MRRAMLCCFLLTAVTTAHTAGAAERVVAGKQPTAIVLASAPRLVAVRGTTVYVARGAGDIDVFLYGVYWYAFHGGAWYRARAYRGPFMPIQVRIVPTAVVSVPSKYWLHPPGTMPGKMKTRGELAAVPETPARKSGR